MHFNLLAVICNSLMFKIISFDKILKLKSIDANQFKKSTSKDITINFILQYKLDILFSNQDGCNFWHDIISKEIKTIIFQYQLSAVLVLHMHVNK